MRNVLSQHVVPIAALLMPLTAVVAACGDADLPPAAQAEDIERAVANAERELADAKARGGDQGPA